MLWASYRWIGCHCLWAHSLRQVVSWNSIASSWRRTPWLQSPRNPSLNADMKQTHNLIKIRSAKVLFECKRSSPDHELALQIRMWTAKILKQVWWGCMSERDLLTSAAVLQAWFQSLSLVLGTLSWNWKGLVGRTCSCWARGPAGPWSLPYSEWLRKIKAAKQSSLG